jgi:hypothetical protein
VPPTGTQSTTASGLSSTRERLSKLCIRAPNCKRLANAFCRNRSCKSCCLKHNGGCDQVRGHRAQLQPHTPGLSSSFPRTPESPPTSSFSFKFPAVIDPALTFESFAESIQQEDPVLQLREACSSQAAAERQAAFREAQLEAQEDAAFQKAITESLRSLSPSSPIPSTSSTSTPSQPIPMSTTSVTPGPPTAFTMAGLPVTRVTKSNRPTITTQMSKDWMRPYEVKSKHPQESPGKGQVDKEVIEKFRIVWWEKVHCLDLIFVYY